MSNESSTVLNFLRKRLMWQSMADIDVDWRRPARHTLRPSTRRDSWTHRADWQSPARSKLGYGGRYRCIFPCASM